MNRILILIAFLATPQLYAAPYESAVKFNEGDVISADVLNDILDRIELSLKDITRDEIIGTWDATQYFCNSSGNDPYVDAITGQYGCLYNDNFSGATAGEVGLYAQRSDTVTIAAVSGSSTLFTFQTTNYDLTYNHNSGTSMNYVNNAVTHECILVAGAAMFACKMDKNIVESGNRYKGTYSNIQRLSPTRIKLFWGADRGGGLFSVVLLDKLNLPPDAPTLQSVVLSNSGTDGTATLTWVAGDATQTAFDVHRKTSASGTFASIATPTTTTYADTSIILNNSYWYRVFATDADGTSIGSNVVKVNWDNAPPSINIASVISVDENAPNATSNFTSLSVSDADAQTLILTLGSQSPGNDASDFTLANNGQLSFNTTPDYESPADYDTNNIYDLKLTATDGIETLSQDFSVVVLDVSD